MLGVWRYRTVPSPGELILTHCGTIPLASAEAPILIGGVKPSVLAIPAGGGSFGFLRTAGGPD
jgi:hypothetical protein